MSEKKAVQGMEEFSVRVAEGTEYAATITCIPDEDADGDVEWIGHLEFDNPLFNLKHNLHVSDGKPFAIPDYWTYPRTKSGGTYLANLMEGWHGRIVAVFTAVREAALAENVARIAELEAKLEKASKPRKVLHEGKRQFDEECEVDSIRVMRFSYDGDLPDLIVNSTNGIEDTLEWTFFGENDEWTDAPDGKFLTLYIEDMPKEEFDALEPWEA